ncbi:uncharacterized protein BO87DRAFT_400344 [Aspergillus neoniger CBS 115656]|uniref:Uncharacterized protein n=1 Tax=Aspergillus neoniger (strain CBS 115656) TaxID=1448310 RepID=A0A318Z029_ASPNB|nr:hypothetical protein BO87DRAFT_400344 [Aspergillus neoniger CBS 115656]PYH30482.1 hypothetical protein BO87DRAFT_400344 [Aspergillus neoniger CBS 115656]
MKQTNQPTKAFPHKAGWAHTTALVNSLDGLVLYSTSSGHRGDDLGNVAADFHLTGRLSEGGQQVVTEADGFPTGSLRPSPTSPNHGRLWPGMKDNQHEAHRGKGGRSKQREFRDEEDLPLGNGRGACGAVCNQLTADPYPTWPLFGLVKSQHFGTRRGGTGDFLAGGNIVADPHLRYP